MQVCGGGAPECDGASTAAGVIAAWGCSDGGKARQYMCI